MRLEIYKTRMFFEWTRHARGEQMHIANVIPSITYMTQVQTPYKVTKFSYLQFYLDII